MRFKALDQIHISAVKPDSLRPGEEFEVSDEFGKELIAKHSARVQLVDAPVAKAEPAAPQNKAHAAAPANKAKPKGKGKSK